MHYLSLFPPSSKLEQMHSGENSFKMLHHNLDWFDIQRENGVPRITKYMNDNFSRFGRFRPGVNYAA